MDSSISSMSYKEKSAFASRSLPDPKMYMDEETETPVLTDVKKVPKKLVKAGRKTKKQKRHSKKRLTLNMRKIR